jgi:hypothetical protein
VGAFGNKLRRQREQRGIALDAISNSTKISTRMLRALEDEHFDQLPGGVFNKGFVRAYARQVGLDEEEAITEYLAALRESQIQAQAILPDFRSPAGTPSSAAANEPLNRTLRSAEFTRNDGGSNRPKNDHDKNDHDKNNPRTDDHRQPDHRQHNHPSIDTQTHDRRKQPRRSEDRRNEDRRNEDRPTRDLSSLPVNSTSTAHTAQGFLQQDVAGNTAESAPSPSSHVPWGKLAAALLLLTLALAVWNSRRRGEPAPPSHPAATTNQAPAKPQTPAPGSAQVSLASQPSRASSLTMGHPSSTGTLSAGSISQSSTTLTLPISASPTSPGTAPLTAASSTSGLVTVTKSAANPDSDVTRSVTNNTARVAVAKPPATFTLLIRAEKTAWVSIVADGQPMAQETLIAPANTSVHATREVVVKTGNAAGVSFLLNGKEIPAEGNDGEVKTYVFDATGVRVAPQPQASAPPP